MSLACGMTVPSHQLWNKSVAMSGFPLILVSLNLPTNRWTGFHLPSDSPLYQSVKASQNTLLQLKLPLQVEYPVENAKCQFWQLRFPALRRLEFDLWNPNLFEPLGSVTDFFLHHSDKIESVIFPYFTPEPIDISFANAHGQLLLQSLKANVSNLNNLIINSMPHIAPSLTVLHLCPEIDDDGSFFLFRFEDLSALTLSPESIEDGLFPSLQDLSVTSAWAGAVPDSLYNPNPADITKLLQRISTFAGRNLRRFSFFAPYPSMTPDELASAISHFPSIVHLALYDSIIQEGRKALDYVRELTKIIPQLEVEFTVKPPVDGSSGYSSY
jgi:hypothetical protein